MSRGEVWAVGILSAVGAVLWIAGVLAHVPAFVLLVEFVETLLRGESFSPGILTGRMAASLTVAIGLGPVLTAVGGGMRFFAGMLAGRKVAGRLAGRIFLWEGLRYELQAISGAVVLGLILLLIAAAPTGLLAIPMGVVLVLACHHLAGVCQLRCEKLMWSVRLENLPPEADAQPMKVLRMSDR